MSSNLHVTVLRARQMFCIITIITYYLHDAGFDKPTEKGLPCLAIDMATS